MFTTILLIFAAIVVLAILAAVLYGLAARSWKDGRPSERTEAIVEVRCGTLVAFDFPSEAVPYQIPQFSPGWYRVPRDAVKKVANEDGEPYPNGTISVDAATIMLVDARFEDALRAIDDRLFEEIKACQSVVYRYEAVVEELGIRFDYLDVGGDGDYILDVSQIEQINDGDAEVSTRRPSGHG